MRKQTLMMIVIALLAAVVIGILATRKDASNNGAGNQVTVSTDVKKSDSRDAEANTNTGSSADANEIAIEDTAYAPETITVKKGTMITWVNKDSAEHTVTGDEGKGPNSKRLKKDDSYSYTFTEAGSFNYSSESHPEMRATVIVTD